MPTSCPPTSSSPSQEQQQQQRQYMFFAPSVSNAASTTTAAAAAAAAAAAFVPFFGFYTSADHSDQGSSPSGKQDGHSRDMIDTEEEPRKKKSKEVSPFDPEAQVPLPSQLEEVFGSTIWRRNERERHRVRCVNEGYERLREHLPVNTDKRISKVDTLRLAIRYIRHLEALLQDALHDRRCRCFHGFEFQSDK